MKKFIALVVMLCAVLISSTASAAADWVWIYSDEYRTIYVDNNSIRRDDNYRDYVFRAFVKWVYSDAGRNKQIEWYNSRGLFPKGIYNISHDIYLDYFKIKNGVNYTGFLNRVCYDSNGNVISELGYSYSEPRWDIIQPDSIGETIFNAVRERVSN